MLGHILRSPENSPAALALSFAVDGSYDLKGRRGRHQTNLLDVIRKDISRIHMSCNQNFHQKIMLKNCSDIATLRIAASNRGEWSKLFNYVV